MITFHAGPFLQLDFDVLQWDTVQATVYFVVPSHFPGAGRYRIDSATLAPGRLKWQASPDFEFGGTGFNASVSLTLDVINAAVRVDGTIRATVAGRRMPGFPISVHETCGFPWPKPEVRAIGKGQIAHVVVVMMENRSLDNLAGWLYQDTGNRPARNIPTQAQPTYDGLEPDLYWNPLTAADIANPDPEKRAYVTTRASKSTIPDPDPHEQFRHMTYQLFGAEAAKAKSPATMKGFVVDYAAAIEDSGKRAAPKAIMECFAPDQVPVLSALARNYAIADRWFASVPCQTWPNRAFVHAGTSCGRVNNLDKDMDDNTPPDPFYYDTKTVFNVLKEVGVTWKVYADTFLPSLTRYQFITQLYDPLLIGHFRGFEDFRNDAALGLLPAYSFVEPGFMDRQNDDHPPHDVARGERFLFDVWKAVSTGPAWNNTLLVITFDEHGGCYDHVSPPWTAVKPDDSKPQKPFGFDRYGVRVPTILVSPWIEPGTVFRSGSPDVEFDHTSILATLREWQSLSTKAGAGWLESARIRAAPTLGCVLTRSEPRTDIPPIPAPPAPARPDIDLDIPLTAPGAGAVAAFLMELAPGKPTRAKYQAAAALVTKLKTAGDALRLIRKMTPVLAAGSAHPSRPVAKTPRRVAGKRSKGRRR